ncbi:MAG: hypothetical protein AB1600_09225 [Bacteroidota bacterium]
MPNEVKIRTSDFDAIIAEQQSLSALALEVERVLRFYEEHPNYPLDITKLRATVMEMYAKVNKSIEALQRIQSSTETQRERRDCHGSD